MMQVDTLLACRLVENPVNVVCAATTELNGTDDLTPV